MPDVDALLAEGRSAEAILEESLPGTPGESDRMRYAPDLLLSQPEYAGACN